MWQLIVRTTPLCHDMQSDRGRRPVRRTQAQPNIKSRIHGLCQVRVLQAPERHAPRWCSVHTAYLLCRMQYQIWAVITPSLTELEPFNMCSGVQRCGMVLATGCHTLFVLGVRSTSAAKACMHGVCSSRFDALLYSRFEIHSGACETCLELESRVLTKAAQPPCVIQCITHWCGNERCYMSARKACNGGFVMHISARKAYNGGFVALILCSRTAAGGMPL